MDDLTQAYLKSILRYDPDTGHFTWIKSRRSYLVGKTAGTIRSDGYVQISIFSNLHLAHRLAWLYIYGEFPENDTDHINHIRNDNSLVNLRSCTRAENNRNSTKRCNNTSGFKGVHWSKCANKWKAEVGHGGKVIYLGIFDCRKEAALAYNAKAMELFGEFACLNEVPYHDLA